MKSNLERAVKDFVQVFKEADKNKTSPFDTQAEVLRVEDGIAWVHLSGGVAETPVKLTMDAKEGDIVQVRVSGGDAWLIGNSTAPPTDDTRANEAMGVSQVAAAAANLAIQSAEVASEAASSAQTSAKDAIRDAGTAKESASSAQASANSALRGLATVEDVVDVVNWMKTHGTYECVPSTETEVIKDKLYWSVYEVENPEGNPRENNYFEYDSENLEYKLTLDTSVKDNKTYYNLTEISNPTGNPYSQGWLQLKNIEDAIGDYINTHLALTDEGLYIMADNTEWKLKITNDGVYILDPNNDSVNKMLSNGNFIGKENFPNMKITERGIYGYNANDIGYFEIKLDGEMIERVYSFYDPPIDYSRMELLERDSEGRPITDKPCEFSFSVDISDKNNGDTTYLFNHPYLNFEDVYYDAYALKNEDNFNHFYSVYFLDNESLEATNCSWYKRKGMKMFILQYYNIFVRLNEWEIVKGEESNYRAYFKRNDNDWVEVLGTYDGGNEIAVSIKRKIDPDDLRHFPSFRLDYSKYTYTSAPSYTFGTRGKDEVNGAFSSVFGEQLLAVADYQTAIGKYNIKNDVKDLALIIGNGDENERSNAFTVAWDGEVEFALDSDATSGIDYDIFLYLIERGWYPYCLQNNMFKLKEFFKQLLSVPTVIQQGTSGSFTYRRWSDGTAEYWGTYSKNVNANTTDNSNYVNYPTDFFISTPITTLGLVSGGADLYRAHIEGASNAKTLRLTLINKHTAAVQLKVHIHSIGRWKA